MRDMLKVGGQVLIVSGFIGWAFFSSLDGLIAIVEFSAGDRSPRTTEEVTKDVAGDVHAITFVVLGSGLILLSKKN